MEISAKQAELEDRLRLKTAKNNNFRRNAEDPLDPRLESPLGRLAASGQITQREYEAGRNWQTIYTRYLRCIGAPSVGGGSEMPSDDDCERSTLLFNKGRKLLEAKGKRVWHAVNAIAVYGEPDEYGDSEFRIAAARIGLVALADHL